jgi:hypothetical protein
MDFFGHWNTGDCLAFLAIESAQEITPISKANY